MRRIGTPGWAGDLSQSLPAEGAGTVIVTTPGGASYLELDRADIQGYFASLELRRQRMLRWVAGTVLFLVLLSAAIFLRMDYLDRQLEVRTDQLARLDESIAHLSEAVPQVVALAVHQERTDQAESVLEMVEYFKRVETVFHAYVDATAEIMHDEIEHMAALLKDAGFDPRSVLARLQYSLPAGGLAGDPRLSDVFDAYVDESVQELFEQRRELRAFSENLPATTPMKQARMTSEFGMRRHPITRRMSVHNGVDFVSHRDPAIRAAGDGTVQFAGRNGGYGKLVVIDHGHDIETRYAHLAAIHVAEGEVVSADDVIGLMGSTGLSTGPHLHFEAHFDGQPLDPLKLLQVSSNVHEKTNRD